MKSLLVFLCYLLFSATTFAQLDGLNPTADPRTNLNGYPTSRPPTGGSPSLKVLSAKETKLWQARVTGKSDSIKQFVSDDAAITSDTGAANKQQWIKQIESGACMVKTYKLKDFVLKVLSPTAIVITYRADQDASCNSKSLPPSVDVNATYAKVQGKWWNVARHETATAPTPLKQ
jgi:hypothetical protein